MVAPNVRLDFADLPLTRLHFATAGHGWPLIIVPATISELDNWRGLIQFMALKFRVYFFELPGHGLSTPFTAGFSTDQVVTTIDDWTKQLGFKHFSLMGFSFGGILALKTLVRLASQIDQIILLSPLVTNQALLFSRIHQEILKLINQAMMTETIQSWLIKTAHSRRLVNLLLRLPAATLDVLIKEIQEILGFNFKASAFTQPCSLAMSINDPLLSFNVTHDWLKQHFPHLSTQKFTFPYHDPPQPLSFEELTADYQPLLEMIKGSRL